MILGGDTLALTPNSRHRAREIPADDTDVYLHLFTPHEKCTVEAHAELPTTIRKNESKLSFEAGREFYTA